MARETGWLIEDEDHFPRHRWLRAIKYSGDEKGTVEWTDDANLALRFGRKRDAVDFAWLFPTMTVMALITEHLFDDGAAHEPPPALREPPCDHDSMTPCPPECAEAKERWRRETSAALAAMQRAGSPSGASDADHYKQRLRDLLPYAMHRVTCHYVETGQAPCDCGYAALAACAHAEVGHLPASGSTKCEGQS